MIDNEIAEKNLDNVFDDFGNSKEKFDAFLMAGDIALVGFKEAQLEEKLVNLG